MAIGQLLSTAVDQDRAAWQRAICASALPASARLVALALSIYSDPSGSQGVWFSASDMARVTGISTLTTVNRYARMLIEAGYLQKNDGAWFLMLPTGGGS